MMTLRPPEKNLITQPKHTLFVLKITVQWDSSFEHLFEKGVDVSSWKKGHYASHMPLTQVGSKHGSRPKNKVTFSLYFFSFTLENLCTRTAQSSRGGHSRRVEKWRVYVHLAVEKGNKILNILLLRVFFCWLLSLIYPALCLHNNTRVG